MWTRLSSRGSRRSETVEGVERKVRWGVLGCAGIAGRTFIPALLKARNATAWSMASRDPGKAREWAGRFGFERSAADYEALLDDPEVQAVYIPLPNHLHAEWSVKASRAGKHVLCEKPMAMSAEEVRLMAAEAEKAGRLLMEAFMYRFHPQMERALGLVREGAVGAVRSVHSSFTLSFAPDAGNYRWHPEMGGGALYDLGCYPVSAARLVFGGEPVSVFARVVFHPVHRVDVRLNALLEFGGGRAAHAECAFDTAFQSRLEVVGETGLVRLSRAFSAKDFDVEVELVRDRGVERIPISRHDQFRLMIEHFSDCVLESKSPRWGPDDAERNMRVLEACLASARSGRPVSLASVENP